MVKKIVICGASGFVGKHISFYFEDKGFQVVKLSRRKRPGFTYWNPDNGEIDIDCLSEEPLIINLCGEGIADSPWTKSRKEKLTSSRIEPIRFLYSVIKSNNIAVSGFISASGINFTEGASAISENKIDETHPYGSGFIENLVKEWEQEALTFKDICPTYVLRIGVVMDKNGGALQKMLPLAKKWVLSPFGSGNSPFPWLALSEFGPVIEFITKRSKGGVYNLCSPELVSYKNFIKSLYWAINKKPIAPNLPVFLASLVFGGRARLFTTGVNAEPKRLIKEGYVFQNTSIRDYLKRNIAQQTPFL
jgi:uncharacterized protein